MSRALAVIEVKILRYMSIVNAGQKIGQKIGKGGQTVMAVYSRMFISIQGYTRIIFRPLSYTQER